VPTPTIFRSAPGAHARDALHARGGGDPERPPGHPLTEALGALPGVSYSRVTPDREVLNEVARIHTAAQRPGRVLLALDASGSMRSSADGGTRLALAAAAVSRSLALMSNRDEFGLWVFQERGVRQLVRLGPGGAAVNGVSRREATARALRKVRAEGRTPLYDAIVAGVRALSPPDPDRVNALIVLTDGQDYGSHVASAAMVAAVQGAGVRVFVVAIGEASCRTPAIQEVARVSAGDCLQAGPGDLSQEIERLFRLLWRGP
jgi:Mg-chelatase subunit ChlD